MRLAARVHVRCVYASCAFACAHPRTPACAPARVCIYITPPHNSVLLSLPAKHIISQPIHVGLPHTLPVTAGFFRSKALPRKARLTKEQFSEICEQIADGMSLTRICNENAKYPSWKTVLRHVQDTDEAYQEYRKARALQAEVLRDQIIDIIEMPLPEDPKLAMAEVQRRRLEVDQKDKYVRQLAPLGVRNKVEDSADSKVSGTITLKWDDGSQ